MATVKKIKKAQSGVTKKPTAFQSYVKKYPGSGSDTIARKDARNNYTNDGFAGTRAKQNADLKSAFTKTYGKKDMTGVDQDDEAKYRVPQKKKGGIIKKAKTGKQMIKRADGSTSQRGLWDNIRAAKGSGKKPTAAMLKQEKKIKAKTKK